MGMDIRLPIGLMFSVFGILLIVFGVFSDRAIYERSLGININLVWGVVLLLFGIVMLVLGRPRSGAVPESPQSASDAKQRINSRSHA